MRQIFFDTETTGLNPESGDRIVEVGCVEMLNRRLTGRHLHLYINPERKGNEEAIKIHGLTDAFLSDKPKFAEIADELLDFLRDADVVIHNAAFDVGFLNAELRRLGREPFHTIAGQVTDTLLMAREMFPGKANSLDALCKRLDVDNSKRTLHGALMDAQLLADVYINLTRGQDSLVIGHEDESGDQHSAAAVLARDLTQYTLAVLAPSDEELQGHDAVLVDLDKASGGKTIWRNFEKGLPA